MNRYNTSVVMGLFHIFKSSCHVDDIQNALSNIVPYTSVAANIATAYKFIEERKRHSPQAFEVKHLHHLLYQNLDRFAGIYRQEGPDWQKIPQLVDVWCNQWELTSDKKDCIYRYQGFMLIRPFNDGNVRVGKMLLLWDFLRNKVRSDTIKKHFSTRE